MKRLLSVKALLVVVIPFGANPAIGADIVRCNFQVSSGLFLPGIAVTSKSKSQRIRLGERGLTRSIFYRDQRLKDYVARELGVRLPRTYGKINRCGVMDDEVDRQPTPSAPVAIEPPTVVEPTTVTPTDLDPTL